MGKICEIMSQFQNLGVAADVRRRTAGKLRESAS
jgi:hypothetical protein